MEGLKAYTNLEKLIEVILLVQFNETLDNELRLWLLDQNPMLCLKLHGWRVSMWQSVGKQNVRFKELAHIIEVQGKCVDCHQNRVFVQN
jgi:hypothetical protein